jgi:hypothetical protein
VPIAALQFTEIGMPRRHRIKVEVAGSRRARRCSQRQVNFR